MTAKTTVPTAHKSSRPHDCRHGLVTPAAAALDVTVPAVPNQVARCRREGMPRHRERLVYLLRKPAFFRANYRAYYGADRLVVKGDLIHQFAGHDALVRDPGQIGLVRLEGTPGCDHWVERDARLDRIFEISLGIDLLRRIAA